MRKKLTLFLALFVMGAGLAMAQTQVRGVVVDETGEPIIGATVQIKGTSQGTATDINGEFALPVRVGATLVVSYVGMKPQELPASPDMQIVMEPTSEMLEELVVLGYGTAKKVGTVIGAYSKVGSEKLELKPVANVLDALQGQVAGLQTYGSSGEPGTTSSVYIRGVGSLNAGNSPLFVVDGTPAMSDILSVINPNDIESVTILKDASATSIYGSRAANGVIYITTKRGKINERSIVTASASYGISSLARRVGNPMNSAELLAFQLKYGIISQEHHDKLKASGIDTKWQDYFFSNNAPTYQANVSVSGGGGRTTYFVSGGYFNEEGVSINSKYEKFNLRSNTESQVNDWMRIGLNLAGHYEESQNSILTYQGSADPAGGIFGTINYQPYYSPYDENGKPLDFIDGINDYGSYYLLEKLPAKSNNTQINATAFVQITPINGLTVRSQGGMIAYDYRYTNKRLPSYAWSPGNGSTTEQFSRTVMMTATNTVEYKFGLGDNHNFTVLLGQEATGSNYEMFRAQTIGQSDDRLTTLSSGTQSRFLDANASSNSEYVYSSFFGRIDYSLKGKYFADLSVRNDGSSRFGKDNKYATFVSGGLMWDMKKEDFVRGISALTDLKVKASIGSTGNSSIGNYDHQALVGSSNYAGSSGWYVSSPGNPDLRWERQILTNIGIDANFFNRYKVEVSLYNRKTKDMLMDVPIPYTTGFGTIRQNVGAMTNQGVEVTANLELVKTKNFYLNLIANYAYNRNVIDQIFYGYSEWPMPSYLTNYVVGESLQFYLPKYAGIDPQSGKPSWYVPNTNQITTDFDMTALSQANGKGQYPPHVGGFGLSMKWKNISLSSDFSWVLGKYMINNDRFFSENPGVFQTSNQSRDILGKIWEKPGDKAFYSTVYSMEFDDHLLENASFMRLKNITLSYSLPSRLLKQYDFFQEVKIYGSSRNLFTLTKYKGADPEIDSNLTYGAYPNSRQFTVGAQIVF